MGQVRLGPPHRELGQRPRRTPRRQRSHRLQRRRRRSRRLILERSTVPAPEQDMAPPLVALRLLPTPRRPNAPPRTLPLHRVPQHDPDLVPLDTPLPRLGRDPLAQDARILSLRIAHYAFFATDHSENPPD